MKYAQTQVPSNIEIYNNKISRGNHPLNNDKQFEPITNQYEIWPPVHFCKLHSSDVIVNVQKQQSA